MPQMGTRCSFFQGKRLPAYLSADAEEGEVSDDDSADEIEDDFKLKSSNVSLNLVSYFEKLFSVHLRLCGNFNSFR